MLLIVYKILNYSSWDFLEELELNRRERRDFGKEYASVAGE
jgi:hypothetical protein